ncbi:hypothetical protein O6H91_07G130200 [Diphasiastrum complanatum]|uniref:Uncharacterized protein n=1 Tax=Diphasiastrum complanatum TaxID=34168 RepID=A0ACC2DA87_DIPCM|nr:hypothetical protein O6H91_07G130200 [Diphasiastrum complanatum]
MASLLGCKTHCSLWSCQNIHIVRCHFSKSCCSAVNGRSQWFTRGSRGSKVEKNRPPAWEQSLFKENKQSEEFTGPLTSEGREQQKKSKDYLSIGNEGEDPYRVLDDGRKVYLDEFDVITLLDPPPSLQPLNRGSYNHAAFLWKKIGDIPEERRLHLFNLLHPKSISRMWAIAGLRYDDPNCFVQDSATMLLGSSMQEFQKPTLWYGRVNEGEYIFNTVANALAPLYFQVRPAEKVADSEDEECDLAFDFGNGQLQLKDSLPPHFPAPGKHPQPFNDGLVAYVRPVGPGMLVGQMWYKHGRSQMPRKFLGEFVLQQEVEDLAKVK